jgi:5-methylcytosine-specific restriction endonuclease McrA
MSAAVLNRPTLILNRSWRPVGVAPVSRSLVLLWNGIARVIDPADFQSYDWADWSQLRPADGEPFVQTVRQPLRVPEVLTLTDYDRVPTHVVPFNRRNLYRRDRFTCQYCGRQPGSEELTVDHVMPRAQGGISTWDNCVLACIGCNARKADRTPDQARMPLRRRPSRPLWRPIYASCDQPIDSWSKFVSEAYWATELEA